MEEKTIQYFSEKEEEFISLLTQLGTQKNMAKVLVFLAGVKNATSTVIERGADLRQPEVSIALSRMKELGWVSAGTIPSERRGRPNKLFCLATPLRKILAGIERAACEKAESRRAVAHRLRSFA